ncbi:GTP diphosphokinase [Citrus sinensis]|uniref:GTP diphosphokinase n=1 Tax=Citrus sinensis TaxID=2711 RepID=A0ACB8MEE9_CITSI|nr:GTP diphosphokinase [Citrus sinensis]
MLGLAQKNSPFPIFFCKFRRNRPKFSCLLDHANVIAAAAAAGKAHGAVTSAITHVAVTAVAIASGACLSTKVQKAIAFAKRAHHGQFRKTGDPYLTHCIHTGRILAMLIPSSGKRAVDTVVAGILHDVVDDACESLGSIEEEFGDEVAKLVAGVSRLSYINQANDLRVMLLGMVDDPRVVLIKLADRLHNMRTIYALPPAKARAVAQETLLIWCSLASRLGLWALKAELEDLCFAVLQPQIFRKMRADLASMWSPRNRVGYSRRITTIVSSPPLDERTASDDESFTTFDEHVLSMKDLLEAVVPFDILSDRRKRTKFLHDLAKSSEAQKKAKVVQDAGIALTSLVACEEALEKELLISTSYGLLLPLVLLLMRRKDVGIHKVYDARALRVVVGDKNGTLHGPAIQCCYSLLDIVHRLWIPIDGEFDDYIVNPKPSGYQSLHTAVQGPDGSALEVQIRTQKMHEYAEHGLAAHWLYKETGNKLQSISSMDESDIEASSSLSKDTDDHNPLDTDLFQKYSSLKMGHPVIRVEGSNLLAAVIIRVEKGGRELLVAVSFGLAASEVVADRRPSFQIKCWEAYARLYKKQDQFGRLLPTFIQITHLTEEEESEYWAVVSAVFEGKPVDSVVSRRSSDSVAPTSMEASINNKVRLLRTMLRWEEQLRSEASLRQSKLGGKANGNPDSVVPGEVVIVCWPNGEIMRLRSGSTAADAAMKVGLEGKLVLVNGQLVLPNTELKDGDIVEVRV